MSLVMHRSVVRNVELGMRTALSEGLLTVGGSELASLLRARDERIDSVTVHAALPGESTRILCTKDVVQPLCKVDDAEIGSGVTQLLDNVAVVTCGPIVGFQEGIIDMSGPGAEHTPFSQLALVVIELEVVAGISPHEHEAAVRSAGLHAAEYLAACAAGQTPDRTDRVGWGRNIDNPKLPRIAYVDMVLSQGLLHDTYWLGRNAGELLPCLADPNLLLDGGLVSGNCVSACDKITTYHHRNNPVLMELLAGHGRRWNFAGVVLTNEPTRLVQKQRCAERAIGLVRELDADGAIITKEGFGNPDADLMMIIRGLEAAGIKTVAITDEYAGPDGSSQSLADTTPEADALVSVGNANQRVGLPAMDRVLGPVPDVARLAGGYAQSLRDDGTIEVELQAIVGSTNQLGFGRLSCRAM